jgi:hypothetical protein
VNTEQYVALAVAFIAATAVVLGPILLYLVKIRHENQVDHAKVVTSVDVLATQVAALTALVVESTSELKAHTKWEETQKYASQEQVAELIRALKDQS